MAELSHRKMQTNNQKPKDLPSGQLSEKKIELHDCKRNTVDGKRQIFFQSLHTSN